MNKEIKILINPLITPEQLYNFYVENCEESFYESISFIHNKGHKVYYIENREYFTGK